MAWEDEPFDDETWSASDAPHPSERSWRHPAELGPLPVAPAIQVHAHGHRTSTLNGILTGVCLVGAALTVAALLMTRNTSVEERALGTTTVPSLLSATSASGPVAFVGSSRSRLGLRVGDIDRDVARDLGILGGAWVTDVEPGEAAAAAGLRADDVILSVDGYSVTGAADLVEHLAQASTKHRPVAVGVLRGSDRLTLRLAIP